MRWDNTLSCNPALKQSADESYVININRKSNNSLSRGADAGQPSGVGEEDFVTSGTKVRHHPGIT